jgi:hypothetical protein
MHTWKPVGVVIEGKPIDIAGLNPWDFEWHQVRDESVELPHPAFPNQLHPMWIYEIRSADRTAMFAAGELSANVWGFYVPAG